MRNQVFTLRQFCSLGLLIGLASGGTFPAHAEERPPATPAPAGLMIGNQRFDKVLFLGNSITLHGPAPKIGWTGNWGMAASTAEKDYVHLLLEQFGQAAGKQPQVMIKNIADFERQLTDFNLQEGLKPELEFQPDVIIIALGENASALKTDADKARFRTAFTNLLAELKQAGQPAIFVRGQFWQNADKDQVMQQTCEAAGGTFVDMSKLGSVEANYARAERKIQHAGVGAHPGDKGMKAIADGIWSAIQAKVKAK